MSLPLGQNIKSVAISTATLLLVFSVLSEGPIPSINFEFRDNVQGFLKRRSVSHFVEFQV
jgi:hypothetical protein